MLDIINPVVIGSGIAVAIFIGILACLTIGRRIAQRDRARHGAAGHPSIGSLEAAVFALLGLMIAFTFSGALSRFDVRRSQVVDEANAIGTAYLRIALLPETAQAPMRETFRNYVDSRISTYRKLPDVNAARDELARSQTLQNEIWAQAVAAVRMPETRPGTEVLVMPALNQMFDITTVRVAATQMHPPLIIYAMLLGLALGAALPGWLPVRARKRVRLAAQDRLCRRDRPDGVRGPGHRISAPGLRAHRCDRRAARQRPRVDEVSVTRFCGGGR
jgi:hypothetical protein